MSDDEINYENENNEDGKPIQDKTGNSIENNESNEGEHSEEIDDYEYTSPKPVYAPPYCKTGAPERDGACDAPMSRACGNYYWMRDSVIPDNISHFGSLIYHHPQQAQGNLGGQNNSQHHDEIESAHTLLTQTSKDSNTSANKRKDKDWMPDFRIIDVILTLNACGFFLADIVSDWRLAILYYLDGEILLFALTVAFIMVPAAISAFISATWSIIDHKRYTTHEKSKNIENVETGRHRKHHWSATTIDRILLFFNVVFATVQLGRCFRLLVFVAYIIKSWRTDKKNHRKIRRFKKKALEQKQDSAILGLVDGFLESSLQFFLQLYLSIAFRIKMDPLRVLTICFSWISTAVIHTAYYRNNRKVQKRSQNVGKVGGFFYFLWRMCEIGPRFYIMVVFSYCFKFWSFVPLFLHFAFILGFYIYQKPQLKGICCSQKSGYPFLLLVSYIGIFCYVNVKKGETKAYVLLYYMVFYLENVFMVVLVYMFFPTKDSGFVKWKYGVLIIIPGFILHSILMTIYYVCFHPNKNVKDGSKTTKGESKKRCENISKFVKNLTLCGIKVF